MAERGGLAVFRTSPRSDARAAHPAAGRSSACSPFLLRRRLIEAFVPRRTSGRAASALAVSIEALTDDMAHGKGKADNLIAANRRAGFDYELGDRYEAGISLIGSEARSIRVHGADVSAAWVDIDGRGQVWVKEMRIPTLTHAAFGHDEKRPRRLLLHREEIERLRGSVEREGMTLIVTRCYFKDGRAKLEFALARGKKKHDKRQSVRAKESEREARQAMRQRR
jgi:SsrA-binding protein